jgi:hypothetical protein
MKTVIIHSIFLGIVASPCALGQSYTNYLRQFQLPEGVVYSASDAVEAKGSQLSKLAIPKGGARFDLWVVDSSVTPWAETLIKSATVGVFIPSVQIVIDTLDSSGKDIAASNLIPVNKLGARRRTRADKPITVYVTTSGLQSGASDPAASKSVTYSHYVQSYGEGDSALNPAQATKLTQSSITTNTTQTFFYPFPQVPLVPGSKFSKLRGEERFSVYTLDDYQKKSYELASQTVNVWPVADGKITGIPKKIRGVVPPITFTYNDIYPDSNVSARCYPGSYVAGKLGELMVGCGRLNSDLEKPLRNFSITVSSLDSYFPTEGDWTIILVTTSAPYGTEPLLDPDGEIAKVTFEIRRTLEVNGTLTTSE